MQETLEGWVWRCGRFSGIFSQLSCRDTFDWLAFT